MAMAISIITEIATRSYLLNMIRDAVKNRKKLKDAL